MPFAPHNGSASAFFPPPDCQIQCPTLLPSASPPSHNTLRGVRALLRPSVVTMMPRLLSRPQSPLQFLSCSPLAKEKTLLNVAISYALGLALSCIILACFVLPVWTCQGLLLPSVPSVHAPSFRKPPCSLSSEVSYCPLSLAYLNFDIGTPVKDLHRSGPPAL